MNTVLVVDDSAVDRRLAGGLLEQDPDWSVAFAVDGKGALEQVAKFAPDVVVTDLSMPAMDGLELVAVMRKEYPRIPVILMTSTGSEEIAVKALQEGAASYVPKRRLGSDLLATVNRTLSASRERQSHSELLDALARHEYHFVLASDLSAIVSIPSFLLPPLAQIWSCDTSDLMQIGTALEEALLNAFYHGNLEVSSELLELDYSAYYALSRERCRTEPYGNRRIFVTATFSHTEATYVVRDEGPGFDHGKLPDPDDISNLDRPYGRGLHLIQTFMDEVSYNARGNEITLMKKRVTPRNIPVHGDPLLTPA